MHEGFVGRRLVINTSPTLALIAAAGTLDFLSALYQGVLMPREFLDELLADKLEGPSVERLIRCAGFTVEEHNTTPPELLLNSLDRGEASVIQLALSRGIPLVGIDRTRRAEAGVFVRLGGDGVVGHFTACEEMRARSTPA
jgi:predicted nucleic acid-binding protein